MLNLLNIIATLFSGYNVHVPTGISVAKIDVIYELNASEIVYNDEDSIRFNLDLTPVVTINSPYFESDTRLDNAHFDTLSLEYVFSGVYLVDVDYIYFDLSIDNIFITCFYDPISTINLQFDYVVELMGIYNDGTDFYYYDEYYYNYDYYTNFSILSVFDFIDEDFTYVMSYNGSVDLGYDAGYNEGYSIGYDDGVEFGFNDGYEAGSNDLDNVFNGSWVEWLGNAVTGFFALEIFPGFTLAGALGAVLCAYIMMWILKVLAGG